MRTLPLALAAMALAACAGLPPRPAEPSLPAEAPLAQAGTSGTNWPEAQWWRGFGDPALDALIERTLADAPDMAAARARVAAAEAGVASAGAQGGLSVAAGAEGVRQRLSDNGLLPPKFLGFHWYDSFQLGLTGTWSPDWWGRNRALVAAAAGQLRAAQAEQSAASLALATSVANLYFAWQADAARLALADERAADAQRALDIHAARTAAQLERDDTQSQARLALLGAQDQQRELRTSMALRRVALAALAGVAPDALPAFTPRPLPEPSADLPADASVALVARRPDLAAARWRVASAARARDVARTAFLPTLSLSGLLGVQSLTLDKLFEAGSRVPQFGAQLALPVFDSSSLHAAYSRSQADVDAAVAAWRGALLAAAREVNASLVTRQGLLEQATLRTQQLAAADALRAAAQARADAGVTGVLPALEARATWLAQRDAELGTRYARLGNELDLVRALGGGYRMQGTP